MSQQRVNANRQATQSPLVIWFEQLGKGDVPTVGGKNASLGEMVCHLTGQGVRVPDGFATTADAYWRFVKANKLEETIVPLLDDLAGGKVTLSEVGSAIRRAFVRGTWPADLAETIASSYRELCRRSGKTDADVAVRSSATAEDLPGRKLRRAAGNFPQYSRRDGVAGRLSAVLRLAIHRSRDLLSASQRL